MRAMIFAAGMGTRLKPFTERHPKALVPVGGVPMLERVMTRLIDAGVTEAVINVHHFADQIVEFVRSRDNFGIDIHISDETAQLLDTGGGLVKARAYFPGSEPIMVHNADILSNIDLRAMAEQHASQANDVTLLAMDRETSRHFYFDRASGRLAGWGDDRNGTFRPEWLSTDGKDKLAFGGVHVINPNVLDAMAFYGAHAGSEVFSVTPFYADFASVLDIRAFTPPEHGTVWLDVGSPQKLQHAEQVVAESLI